MNDKTTFKTAPHDLDAEQIVLGTMFLDNNSIPVAMETISSPDLYYDPRHRIVHDALMSLYMEAKPVDLVTVTNRLKETGNLEAAGGPAYLSSLIDVIPLGSSTGAYCRIIKEHSTRRQVIVLSTEAIQRCYSLAPVEAVVEDFGRNFFGIVTSKQKGPEAVSKRCNAVVEDIKARTESDDHLSGIKTGFYDIDRLLSGLQPSDLIILAARPSMGKTALALNIALHAAKTGNRVLFFSLEMSTGQLIERMLSTISTVNNEAIRRGMLNANQINQVMEAENALASLPISIDDTAALSIQNLRARANRFASRGGLGLIIVDYLQLMTCKADSREREVAQISSGLKAIAKDLRVPMIALSQLNRSLEQRTSKRPRLSDLRDSGSIEQDADVVAFIYRDEVYNKSEKNPTRGTAEVIVAKHRNGRTGEVTLNFEGQFYRFKNCLK